MPDREGHIAIYDDRFTMTGLADEDAEFLLKWTADFIDIECVDHPRNDTLIFRNLNEDQMRTALRIWSEHVGMRGDLIWGGRLLECEYSRQFGRMESGRDVDSCP